MLRPMKSPTTSPLSTPDRFFRQTLAVLMFLCLDSVTLGHLSPGTQVKVSIICYVTNPWVGNSFQLQNSPFLHQRNISSSPSLPISGVREQKRTVFFSSWIKIKQQTRCIYLEYFSRFGKQMQQVYSLGQVGPLAVSLPGQAGLYFLGFVWPLVAGMVIIQASNPPLPLLMFPAWLEPGSLSRGLTPRAPSSADETSFVFKI